MTQRTKRTWTQWRRLIREHERSGQSVAEFCRERELHASYFFAFRKRLRESATARFVEVQVAEPRPHTASDSRVELRLRNGRSLIVGRGFDAEHVRALLALAEAAG
jgi:transposase-like protein